MAEYIDRELVHKAINDNQYSEWFYDGLPSRVDRSISIGAASCAINNIPVADVAPVIHAKWKDDMCSNCHCDVPAYIIDWKWTKDMDAKYCPNCGAKMDKE